MTYEGEELSEEFVKKCVEFYISFHKKARERMKEYNSRPEVKNRLQERYVKKIEKDIMLEYPDQEESGKLFYEV